MLKKYQILSRRTEANHDQIALIQQADQKSDKEMEELAQSTKQHLEGLLNSKAENKIVPSTQSKTNFYRFTPGSNIHGFAEPTSENSSQKILCVREMPKDPCEPSKFKHRRMQKENDEEQIPVLRSPPRKLTQEDYKNWKIPPCISNYKNQKGYTIPIQMRLMADMRSSKDLVLSDKFSKFADVLNLVEKESRKEIEQRNKANEYMKLMNTLKQEQELLAAAEAARKQKLLINTSTVSSVSNIASVKSGKSRNSNLTDDTFALLGKKTKNDSTLNDTRDEVFKAELEERNRLRNLLNKEIKRDYKVNRNNAETLNSGIEKRDISERIALGQAQPTPKEFLIDSRLYNQTSGVDPGFKDDEEYDLYTTALFTDRSRASIFKNIRTSAIDDDSMEMVKESKKLMDKITQRGNMFEGTNSMDNTSRREQPVDFISQKVLKSNPKK